MWIHKYAIKETVDPYQDIKLPSWADKGLELASRAGTISDKINKFMIEIRSEYTDPEKTLESFRWNIHSN